MPGLEVLFSLIGWLRPSKFLNRRHGSRDYEQ
jgi:hypothetical protein